ncbi:MAG: GNAT family N-acetyltransferase [Oscillospiraceae bacterium]|nr:GNAT family N-acetyltransferase [Oscillospiraceae bacterium]
MIREATRDDVKALAGLYKDLLVFHNQLDRKKYNVPDDDACDKRLEWFLEFSDIYKMLCHETDGVVDGYVVYMLPDKNSAKENNDGVITVNSIVVAEDARGNGIGEELINEMLKLAKENYCNTITVDVHLYNGMARKFFEKMGMIPTTIHLEKRL